MRIAASMPSRPSASRSTAPISAPAARPASVPGSCDGCGMRAIGCGRIARPRFIASTCRSCCSRSSALGPPARLRMVRSPVAGSDLRGARAARLSLARSRAAASRMSAKRCSASPLPPRIARIFLQGFGAVEGCRACAWLAEPTSSFAKASEDRRLTAAPATTSDLLTVLDRWRDMPANLHKVSERLERIAAAALGTKRRDERD